jgi:hypothetical protein
MKKLFLAIAVLLCAILALAACGPKEPPHEHSYNETVIYDATCTTEGILRITCSCGYSEDQTIPAKGHTIAYKKALDPDCQQRGYYEHFYCEDCNKNFHDQSALDEYPDAELYIDKLEHEYEYEWVWDGVESATISIYCVAGCEFEYEHTVTDIYSYTAYYPTCTMDGEMYYNVSYNFNGWTISDSKTAPIPALNHKWGEPEWTWDGKTASASFCCENDEYHVEVITATISSEVTKDPTCHSLGATTYTATVSFGGETHTDTKEIYDVARLEHTPTVDVDHRLG